MNRIVKLRCLAALFAITFVLALVEAPRAEAHPHCTLQEIEACNDYCGSRGCLGTCIQQGNCMCAC